MVIAFGGGAEKDELGSTVCALAPTVTYAKPMPRTEVKSWPTRVVITTWTHVNWPAPWQACGTGEPGSAIGGECNVILLPKPLVAPQGIPDTSNQGAVKEVGVLVSHAVE